MSREPVVLSRLDEIIDNVFPTLPVDNTRVKNYENHKVLQVPVPGVKAEDVIVHVENGYISWEVNIKEDSFVSRKSGRYGIPKDVDSSTIETDLTDGVLSIVFTKKEETKPREVKVKTNALDDLISGSNSNTAPRDNSTRLM